jgi:hypothetical protein
MAAWLVVIVCALLLLPLTIEALCWCAVGVLWICSIIGMPLLWLERYLKRYSDMKLSWNIIGSHRRRSALLARLRQASGVGAETPAPRDY